MPTTTRLRHAAGRLILAASLLAGTGLAQSGFAESTVHGADSLEQKPDDEAGRRARLREQLGAALADADLPRAEELGRAHVSGQTGHKAAQARAEVVGIYLDADLFENALGLVNRWKESGVALDELGQARLVLAGECVQKKDWNSALEQYGKVMEGKPSQAVAAIARLGMARVYERQGDEPRMLELLKAVAEMEPVNTHADLMDASNTRNQAYEWLAGYYYEKQQWKESLAWYQKWVPTSWCGTCRMGMESSRRAAIAECEKKIREAGR
jgi:tetratricopeptide (TPR) repeat protein